MTSAFRSERSFFAVSALVFAAGVAATLLWSRPVPEMDGMGMSGMGGMEMGGGGWAVARFLGPWLAMTAAMMLPSLVPMLRRYRQVVRSQQMSLICCVNRTTSHRIRRTDSPTAWEPGVGIRPLAVAARAGSRLGRLTLLAGLGYFLVWAGLGLGVFALGPELAMASPLAVGMTILLAGAYQFTPLKLHHLACCRTAPAGPMAAHDSTALRHGIGLGFHCALSCTNLMAALLVLGAMDWGWMTLIGAAITAERLAPAGRRVARAIGAALIGAGLLLIAHAAGLG